VAVELQKQKTAMLTRGLYRVWVLQGIEWDVANLVLLWVPKDATVAQTVGFATFVKQAKRKNVKKKRGPTSRPSGMQGRPSMRRQMYRKLRKRLSSQKVEVLLPKTSWPKPSAQFSPAVQCLVVTKWRYNGGTRDGGAVATQSNQTAIQGITCGLRGWQQGRKLVEQPG
jgi:hypothetical protein